MADTVLRNGKAFLFCTECGSENLVCNHNRPPKFCYECGGKLPQSEVVDDKHDKNKPLKFGDIRTVRYCNKRSRYN